MSPPDQPPPKDVSKAWVAHPRSRKRTRSLPPESDTADGPAAEGQKKVKIDSAKYPTKYMGSERLYSGSPYHNPQQANSIITELLPNFFDYLKNTMIAKKASVNIYIENNLHINYLNN